MRPSPQPDPQRRLPVHAPNVVFSPVDDGGVLLSLEDEVYFGLNEVGARIWQVLPECATLEDLCRRIETFYPDTDPATVRGDVRDLLEELAQFGLLTGGQ